jgi:GAF domain-containing protein
MGPVKEPNTYEQQLVVLGQVLQTLREAEQIDVLIEATLGYLKASFHPEYELLWIGLYDRVDHRILGKGGFVPAEINSEILKQRLPLSSGDLLEQIVIQQRPLAVADLRQEMRAGDWRKVAQKHGIQGTMLFPITHCDRCLGVVMIASRRWGTFPTANEKACLSMVLGQLANSLYQAELEWQHQQIKRPDKPLLYLLQKMRSLSNLGQRMEAVVEESQRFIAASRTSIYWFEPNQRYFWRRLSNHNRTSGLLDPKSATSGITAQEINSFYQSLLNDQVVAIGEAQSSLRADATSRLMQQIRARSLLAAPILYQKELIGFLAVEGNEARIWQEEEKQYLRGAAQMLAIVSPLEDMENVMQRTQLDYSLTAEIAQSLYGSNDWKLTLNRAAELLGRRLNTERFMVLLHDNLHQKFELCYQNQPKNRRACVTSLPPLSQLDWQSLEQSEAALGIENLEEDLRLGNWRNQLMDLGVRSLLASSTSAGNSLEGLLLVCHERPRSWSPSERLLIQGVAQQIGLILRQWQLQKQHEQQQQLNQSVQRSITLMQQSCNLADLEQAALQAIAGVMETPLAFLVSWFPGRRTGKLVLSTDQDKRFALNPRIKVSIHADPLLRMALEQEQILRLTGLQIPGETRQWLNPQGIGQLLVIALRTNPEDEPAGLLAVVDEHDRQWSDRHLTALEILANQLANARRHLKLEVSLQEERLKLEQMSWYRQHHLEEVHRVTQIGVQKLLETVKSNPDALFVTRQQQILRQIQDALQPIQTMLHSETGQLQFKQETLPLIGLVRRALERTDATIKQQQLWSQVHHESNPVVMGDGVKLEMVLYALINLACQRSQSGGRIDIWCRQFDRRWVEIAITDDGQMEPRLLQELEGKQSLDPLAPNTLNQAPGLYFSICKSFITAMEGDFSLMRLEDGRIMSRIMLGSAQQGGQGR